MFAILRRGHPRVVAHLGLGRRQGQRRAYTPQTLLTAGLLCIALHLAGIGTSTSWRGRRSR